MRPLFFSFLFLCAISFICVLRSAPAWAFASLPLDPVLQIIPNDPYWNRQWYLRQIHMPEAWGVTTGTKGVIVAVIDAGVDITHPELQENIWTNEREIPNDGIDNEGNGYIDDVHGWNFVSKSPDVRPMPLRYQEEEAWSHGTFVVSILAGKGNNQQGIAGVNWNVRVIPLVALDGDGFGQTAAVVQAIRYAVNQGASIINLSLAGHELDPALEEMIRRAHAGGVLIVAATGNDDSLRDGRDIDHHPVYPVCMDGEQNMVLGVGGTDTLDQKSPYANYGQRCTDISAPAQEFFAARPSYPKLPVGMTRADASTSTPHYLDGMTGTSLAAPLVSGVASLIKSVRPDATPDQIKNYIIYHADRIEENLTDVQKGKMGSGRLNAYQALKAALVTESVTSSVAEPLAPRTTTSTIATDQGIVFSRQEPDRTRTWIVSQKPIEYGWISSDVYALFLDKKGYEWKKWDALTGVLQTRRLKVQGKGWVMTRDQTSPTMLRFTHAKRKDAYLFDYATGQEKNMRKKK